MSAVARTRRDRGLRAEARRQLDAVGVTAARRAARPDPIFVPLCFLVHAIGVAALPWLEAIPTLAVSILLGISSMQLVVIAHDGMHGSLRIPRWTHLVLGRLLSAYSFVPYHYLRYSHLTHHQRAGLIEGDPEILHPSRAAAHDRVELRIVARLARWPIAPLVFFPILQVVGLVRFLWRPPVSARAHAARRATIVDLTLGPAFWGGLAVLLPWPVVLELAVFGLAVPMAVGTSLMHLGVFTLVVHPEWQ